jgi:PAS domain S-box-containing protein
MEKAVQDLLDGRSVRFECELYRKDGTTFWSEWYSRPSFLADGSFRWLSIERDITALKERIVEMSALRRALDESADFVLTAEGTPASGGSPMVSYANEPFLTAFGYARAELVGQPLTILAGPATDKALLHDLQERLEQGDSATRELLLYRSDGSALWVELSTQPVEGDNGRVARWVVVARDVSRRRRTQEQLLVLSTAIQHANDAIVIYAIDSSGRRKPRVVYINDAVLKNSGFTREEVFNQSTGVGPKTDKGALRSLRDRLNRGESVRTRLELYRKDGSSYWAEIDARPIMDERGRVTHWISIERDISDVVARERQLERERRIFANLHVAVAELVGALDRRSLADAFSRGVESVGECTTDRLQPAGAAPAHDQPIVRSDDARKVLLNAPDAEGGAMQLILRRRDAEGFDDVALVALQLYLQAYHSALHNVGLYEELAARRSTVIELNQSKSDLIAMLAHDFKGPLASIIGFSQLLQQEFAPSDEAHDMLAQIERGAYRLVDLANDTLAFSRAEQNELAIDVTDNDYVELLSEIAALHKDQRAIQVIAAGGPVIGRFDWQRMRQVFDNLISNAIKYSPTGEPVHIGVSRVGNAAVIAVRDHGIGIPANELQSIFERFGRGTNAKAARIKGTGFGLYLARSIVEQHGGRIGVESRVGYGSAFTVTVPLQLPLELAASQRALVVDPEGDVRSFVAYTLRSNGYAVRVAETAAAALEFLDAGAFGLCVLDSDAAPDESGTLQTLVQRARQAGAAVVTLHGKQRREAPGGDVALEKPYLTGELFAAITNATQRLKEHSLARQHPSG